MAEFVHGYALVIGIGDYEPPLDDLPFTSTDAIGVAQQLLDPASCAYPPEQVRLLTGRDANRQCILAKLDWLAVKAHADPEATVLVYFSGHGLKALGFHLLPYGYDLEDLNNTAISGKELKRKLRAIPTAKLILILDCCYAALMGQLRGSHSAELPPEVIKVLTQGKSWVTIASSQPQQLSFAGDRLHPNSTFTQALLEAFAGYGEREQPEYVRLLDIKRYVQRVVNERTNGAQSPIFLPEDPEDNFALAYLPPK